MCSYKLFKQRGESFDKGELIVKSNVAVAITATASHSKKFQSPWNLLSQKTSERKIFESTKDLTISYWEENNYKNKINIFECRKDCNFLANLRDAEAIFVNHMQHMSHN